MNTLTAPIPPPRPRRDAIKAAASQLTADIIVKRPQQSAERAIVVWCATSAEVSS